MAERCGNDANVIVSPKMMTDYYKSTKNPGKGSKAPKTSKLDTSSVYLTPESSPAKDKSCVSPEGNGVESPITEMCPNCNNNRQIGCECNVTKSHVEDSVVMKSDKTRSSCVSIENTHCNGIAEKAGEAILHEMTNGKALEDEVSTKEEFEQPVLSHTRKSDIFSSPATVTTQVSSGNSNESSAASSPSVPRPKVRRGRPSKKKPPAGEPSAESEQVKPKPNRRKKKESAPVQNSTITDFFPIRRSGRQTKGEIMKQRHELLAKLILSNSEDGLKVEHFEEKGRGVVATKRFEKGDFVIEYAGDFIDIAAAREREEKYSLTPEVGCYMYFFVHVGKHYCVDATAESDRLGRLINHSRDGNCRTEVVPLPDGPRLILVAAKDIEMGWELSYDYGDRRKSSLEAHPWLKL